MRNVTLPRYPSLAKDHVNAHTEGPVRTPESLYRLIDLLRLLRPSPCALRRAERPDRYYQAAVAILFAIFFDAFDGRVARLTRTQSEFGTQLDSLADVISFGVGPSAKLLWLSGLAATVGFYWDSLLSFLFSACGAM